jgi:hypothetical protein
MRETCRAVQKCSARLSFVVYSGIYSSHDTVLVLGLGDGDNSCHVSCRGAGRLFAWKFPEPRAFEINVVKIAESLPVILHLLFVLQEMASNFESPYLTGYDAVTYCR